MSERSPADEDEAPVATTTTTSTKDDEEDDSVGGLLSTLNRSDYDPSMLMQALALLKKAKLAANKEDNESVGSDVSHPNAEATTTTTTVGEDEPRCRTTSDCQEPATAQSGLVFAPVSPGPLKIVENLSEEGERLEVDAKMESNESNAKDEDTSTVMVDEEGSTECGPAPAEVDLPSSPFTGRESSKSDGATSTVGTFLDSWPDVVVILDNKVNDVDDDAGSRRVASVSSPSFVGSIESESVASTSAASLGIRFPRVVLKRILPGAYFYNSRPCPASKKMRLGTGNKRSSSSARKSTKDTSSSSSSKDGSRHAKSSSMPSSTSKDGSRHAKSSSMPSSSSSSRRKLEDKKVDHKRTSSDSKSHENRKKIRPKRPKVEDKPRKCSVENLTVKSTHSEVKDHDSKVNSVEVVKTNSVKVVKSNLVEDVKTNSVEVVRTNSAEVVKTNLAEVVKTNSAEVVKTNSAEVVKTNSAKIVPPKTVPECLFRKRSNSESSVIANPREDDSAEVNSDRRVCRRFSFGDKPGKNSEKIVKASVERLEVRSDVACSETMTLPGAERLQVRHSDEVVIESEAMNEPEKNNQGEIRDKTPIVSDGTREESRSAKHKKKKHQHHHHHHSKQLDAEALRKSKKKSRIRDDKDKDQISIGAINGFSTPTERTTTDLAASLFAKIPSDDKLRVCTCVVRLERLHPAVVKRLARHGYVRTGSRHGSSAPPPPPPRPPSSDLKNQQQQQKSDADADAMRRRRQRREQKLESFKRMEREREVNQQRMEKEREANKQRMQRERELNSKRAVAKTKPERRRSFSPEPSVKKAKRRRIVEVVSTSDEENTVQSRDEPASASICAPPSTSDCGGLTDVYGSFDVDVVKDALQVDDFLLSGNSGLDVPASFAGDDDVLLQARQVGPNADDEAPTYDDNYWLGDAVWQVVDVCSRTSDGRDECGGNAAFAEDNLNEYETYLDDCDFLGERPPEKSSDPIPDDIYLGQPRKRGTDEQLKVQINGVINPSFLNHSPVKLSPHNVMLSSSVCDVPVSKEDLPVRASGGGAMETLTALCVPSMDSQKSNMAAAPFAMTSDLDVTTTGEPGPPSPASVQVHADSDHNARDSHRDSEESATQEQPILPSRFQQLLLDEDHDTVDVTVDKAVWKFGQPPPKDKRRGTAKNNKKCSKTEDVPNDIDQVTQPSIKPNSLAARIAKELGTTISDDYLREEGNANPDAASLLAYSPLDDSMTGRQIASASSRVDGRLRTSKDTSAHPSSSKGGFQPEMASAVSALAVSLDDLERLSTIELEQMFEYDVSCANHASGMILYSALLPRVEDGSARFGMLTSLLTVAKDSEFSLSVEYVGKLFCAVVEMAPSFKTQKVHQQIRILGNLFAAIKKCEPPASTVLCNFTRTRGPKYGSDLVKPPANISEVFNQVLRRAINADAAELLQFYRAAIDVGMDIDASNLRSLVIVFHPLKELRLLARDLYRIGCCMTVYPRVRIREWPHCIKIKSFYSEVEIEIIVHDFILKMTKKLETDMGFYVSRSSTKDEILTVYISVEELTYPDKSKLFKSIKSSLAAVISRLMNVFKNWLSDSLIREVVQRDKGRLVIIRPKATAHLITTNMSIPEVQQDKCDDSDSSS